MNTGEQPFRPDDAEDGHIVRLHDALSPVVNYLVARADEALSTIVVGISGAQGSGKTTIAAILRDACETAGKQTVVLSIDDFYLSRAARSCLAARVHPLLATRGPPGTHDLALAIETIQSLRAGRSTRLPRFNKAIDDAEPISLWTKSDGRIDIVVLEGWCIGALPQEDGELAAAANDLERMEDPWAIWRTYVNTALKDYQRLFALIDCQIALLAPSFALVEHWRMQQEVALSNALPADANALPLLDRRQMHRFVALFERITKHMMSTAPGHADIAIELGSDRQVLAVRIQEREPQKP